MARLAGIQFENDSKGNHRYVRIDLKKHAEQVIPLLEKLGAIDEDDEFEKEWKSGGLSSSEAKAITKKKIKEWWGK